MPEVADRDRIAMIAELANASGIAGMCGGQALDLAAEGQRITLDALERIHRHKTGALIRAAVRLGALSAGDKGRNTLPILDAMQRVSALPSRFRMTFWMWWAILQR
ncbi:geranyltranstransferase [Salmonella enterica subsp. enterica]|uniref:Geranyltranstransferase n=1 Tax=Salmonella enterica I TaxID=59201 RepID=A0A379X0N6_SALET|nr:geranyltranstransferase [Salmonella enterica subsp. enterica]